MIIRTFQVGQDSLIFTRENPCATLEIWLSDLICDLWNLGPHYDTQKSMFQDLSNILFVKAD